MKYRITVSENQFRVIMIALESYFRVRMGQFDDLSDDLAFNGFDYDAPNDEKRAQDFGERIARRNSCREMMDKACRIAQPRKTVNDYYGKTPDMVSAIDIWHVIRHQRWLDNPNRQFWTVDSTKPWPESGEKLPEVEKIEDG